MRNSFLWTATALTLAGRAAAAPPVLVLMPDDWSAAPDGPVSVRLHEFSPGLPASVIDWPAARAEWMLARGGGRQANLHHPAAAADDPQAVTVTAPAVGVLMVGVDLTPALISIDASELAALVPDGERPVAARAPGPVTVLRAESAAALVRVVTQGADRGQPPASPVAVHKTGLRCEIRPLMDPTAVGLGSDLPVRVYVDGASIAGARVTVTPPGGGRAVTVEADSSGIAYIALPAAGAWRAEFHHAAPAPPDDPRGATLIVYSGSLAFEAGGWEARP